MCTEAVEMARDEKEQTFEDFKRIILDGAVNCEDEGHAQD
jgi:hypothetical protein